MSVFLHLIVFALVSFSGYLNGSKDKGLVHYVNLNFVGLPGGPGGGGGGGSGGGSGPGGSGSGGPGGSNNQPAARKETMKELTVPQKAQPESQSSLRYPEEKTARTKTKEKTPPKKTAIQAPQPGVETGTVTEGQAIGTGGTGTGGGGGSGLRIGVGEGPGGGGFGYGDPLATSSFPYTYYLQIIIDRVSGNWFTATSNLNFSGEYQSVIYFKILKNGQIADLKIEQPSNLPALDLSARRAVELAAPFPPLPRDFENDYLVIHLIFERSQ